MLRTLVPTLALPALLLVSCGGGTAPKAPAAPAAVAPVPPPAKAESSTPGTPGESGTDEYVYNPIGKRDPFRTFITAPEEEQIRSPTPLQRFEIDQYTLTGIIWGTPNPRAMVEDPEGVGHVVEIGTYIGKNWGKVTEITSNKILVNEEYLTVDGSLVTNPIEISLPEQEEPE
jgi:type IV pilus assembly protein PilP